MDDFRQYIISITVASLISGVAVTFSQNGPYKKEIKILCGLLMTCTLLRPLLGLPIPELPNLEDYLYQAEVVVHEGAQSASLAQQAIISQKCAAYILGRGAELHEDLSAEVTVENRNEALCLVSAEIRGCISQENKEILSQMIAKDLGIQKENQLWICEGS